ncbi:MAG: TlpA family protein disulfide reductase [Chloroflexi bacterium]|nr:TlpA family protein disulfide reductase [Chloroflexota bacterium]
MMDETPQRSGVRQALPLILSALAILVGVALIVLPTAAPPTAIKTAKSGQLPKDGETPLDFELKTLTGEMIKLSALRGSPVLINFWATWCGPCKEEMPLLVEQYNWNKGRGLRVLAIDSVAFDNLDDIHKYVDQYKMTFDVLLDEDDQVSLDWAIMGLPSSIFIKPDGTVAAVKVGQMSSAQLNEYLKLILPTG